jgi:RNA polymerase sigma-70 factor, ECF subfamily
MRSRNEKALHSWSCAMHPITEEQALDLLEMVRLKVRTVTKGQVRSDFEDIVQEVVVRVLEQLSEYDPSRASLRTFQSRLIDRAYVDIYRRERAAKRGKNRKHVSYSRCQSVSQCATATSRAARRSEYELSDLKSDVEYATTGLTADQNRLCELVKTKPVPDVANEEGVHRGTVYRRLQPIRHYFESLQLAAYLD